MKDTDIMQFGAHKGKELQDVPASWLLWLHSQIETSKEEKKFISSDNQKLFDYIEDNMQVLQQELKK